MNKILKPRGTYDLFQTKYWEVEYLYACFTKIAILNNFQPIETPIFEDKTLFTRSLEQWSEIVNKELYEFQDRSQRHLALRPEGTAGVIRAFIENQWATKLPLPIKLFYQGNMFRYERPQAERKRSFKQWGVEVIGAHAPSVDIQIIMMAYQMLTKLGLKNIKILINSLGSKSSIAAYLQSPSFQAMIASTTWCDSCEQKKTFHNNIKIMLTMLDCKTCQHHFTKLPNLYQNLSDIEKQHLQEVATQLTLNNIPYEIDFKLVRGLNYYTSIIFEIVSLHDNMTKATLVGGGRYDDLTKLLGGTSLPACGFAIGIERMLIALTLENITLPIPYHDYQKIMVFIDNIVDNEYQLCINWLQALSLITIHHQAANLDNFLKLAYQQAVDWVMIRENEWSLKHKIEIRHLTTDQVMHVDFNQPAINQFFKNYQHHHD